MGSGESVNQRLVESHTLPNGDLQVTVHCRDAAPEPDEERKAIEADAYIKACNGKLPMLTKFDHPDIAGGIVWSEKELKAIAHVMGETLLLAMAGETFRLSAQPVWVRPLAIAISVRSHA